MIRLAAILAMLSASCAFAGSQLKPPARYDHPFAGEVQIIRHQSGNIERLCGYDKPGIVRGCASVVDGVCVIQIAVYAKISDPAMLIRHETAHCNGWPEDHPE